MSEPRDKIAELLWEAPLNPSMAACYTLADRILPIARASLPMGDDLVERVARAIAPEAWGVLETGRRDLIKYQCARSNSLRYAKAAISVMVER